jgi:hypothetical protein
LHDLGSEEVIEEPLDATNPFWKLQTNHFSLRIKPLVLKRQWRGMSIKKNNNFDEAQHVEILLYFLLLDEGEVVQACFPPAHEVEEVTNLNDK